MREHLRGRVRLQPSNSQFDGDVADVLLHEFRQSSHLGEGSGRRSRERAYFLFDLGRRIQPAARQVVVPLSHIVPSGKAIRCRSPGWEEGHDHLPGDSPPRRHVLFFSNLFHIPNRPLPQAASGIVSL